MRIVTNAHCTEISGKNDFFIFTPPTDRQFKKHLLATYIDEGTLLDLGRELVAHVTAGAYSNPVDVATVIDMLEMLVNTQVHNRLQTWTLGNRNTQI